MDTLDYDPNHPRTLDTMAGATEWSRLRAMTERADPSHIVVVGPAGTGKSCALRLALKGKITLWMRCSQDPTLRDNRERIKMSARRRVANDEVSWIVLEHADMLHADSQAFLRRIIETSVGSTRFVLEVRDAAAIAEPLLSRTVMFHGPSLMPYEITAEIMRRKPDVDPATAMRLANQSGGNIRWAVLQALGESDGFIDTAVMTLTPEGAAHNWSAILQVMEDLQRTGTSPRAWLGDYGTTTAWDRPGGICPWALTAHILSRESRARSAAR